jgi:hypothetical protein
MTAEEALAKVRAFVDRNRGVYPLRESLPSEATSLARLRADPAVALPLLRELVRLSSSYDFSYSNGRNAYAGQDLQLQVALIEAIGEFGAAARSELPWLESIGCRSCRVTHDLQRIPIRSHACHT